MGLGSGQLALVSRNLLDDLHQVRVIVEGDVGHFQLAGPFDEDLLWAIDQNIVDGVVLKKRFKGPEPRHFVIKFLVQRRPVIPVEHNAALFEQFQRAT